MRKILSVLFSRVVLVAVLMLVQIALVFGSIFYFRDSFWQVQVFIRVASIALVVRILNGRRNPAYKLIWIVLVLVVPVFGFLMYLIFGKVRIPRATRLRMKGARIRSHVATGDGSAAARQAVVRHPAAARQSHYIASLDKTPLLGTTNTEYFPLGEVMFERMMEKISTAERYIFLEYFIIREGVMWDSMLELLLQKVDEGVDVRLVYDDLGCIFTLPYQYDEKLRQMGIKCSVFNPFVPVLSSTFNNRSHRKTCIIDGHTAFIGGINLADEYINEFEKYGHWKDTGVMIEGEAAWPFATQFLAVWDYTEGEPLDFASYKPAFQPSDPQSGYAQPYSDTPLDEELVGSTVYMNMINAAERYLYITTPYLIIDNEMLTALCTSAKNGVDMRIITPHQPDKWYIHPVTQSYYQQLIEAGVRIFEYTPGFIHAKSFVSDDMVGVVGTINLDYRSLYLHFENSVWMYQTSAVRQLLQDFEKTLEKSQEITLHECKTISLWQRIGRGVLRIFSPLM